ncbi:MAG: pilus assembly protein [Proteobacteria bacterium]|jgi:Flp pilus assembly protein TadG|nr:pilus assembly protein [Pseudomonadota bacterium]
MNRRGSYALEFSLVFPLLLPLMSGVIDYGHYLSQEIAMVAAVQEGARTGASTPQEQGSNDAATTEVEGALLGALGISDANVVSIINGNAPDQIITVSATVPFQPPFGLVPVPSQLAAEMTLRMEDQQ